MYREKKIALVAIAYNEELLIVPTLEAVPDFVDQILVVDDSSTDRTADLVTARAADDSRVHLIRHIENRGPGAAIISGYLWSYLNDVDIVVIVGGDNQMDQSEMHRFLDPLIDNECDYCKGNRFLVDAFKVMPIRRLFGNISLSILTVAFSGNWGIFDTQDGYTSITREAIGKIDWRSFHEGYGYVTDFIIRMKPFGIRIKDVPRRSIYLENQRQSQIHIAKYIRRFFKLWFNALRFRLTNNINTLQVTTKKVAQDRTKSWIQIV